jgi:probable F420-dependent oxidoreductase
MKIGLLAFISENTIDPASLGKKAESLGFESLFFPEHAIIPVHHKVPYPAADGKIPEPYAHFPDPFVCCAMAAAATTRLNLGTGICLVPEHDPIVLAKTIATVDHYSGGRFLFGIGAGWLADESEIMGVDFRRRWTITREYIRAMKELWTKPEPSFSGEFVNFPQVKSYPKPAHKPHPPVLIGAGGLGWKSGRAIKDTVEWGDGWMPVYMTAAELSGHLTTMKELCKNAGRDYSKIDITMTFLQQPELQPSDPNRAIEEFGALGVHRLILSPSDLSPGQADRVLEDIARKYVR